MHALDAQYHRNCLIALDNPMCSKQSNCQGGNTNSMSVKGVALAELFPTWKSQFKMTIQCLFLNCRI